ncbi:hypothetical protein Tco_1006876 [Tanacetum coccineum]|uniref:Reverse transcriptase domain-containing protein n=1 Tax=Tanacetum coccineum TaxID=301880 RepID=A0ABQ5FJ41_9ASTR
MLIADITETFDNLRRINMKLNPKKCSFGVEEGKFLGYMVTSKGIRANPKKTKGIADMQSPLTLKEMQSLSGIKSIPINEAIHRGATVINHSCEGGNVVCVSGSGNRGRERGIANGKKRKTVSGTQCQQDIERGRKKLCLHGKVGFVIATHVVEITKVLRGSPHQGHNGSNAEADTEQSPSVRETR